ncbi:MAG: hypothetical protein KJ847_05335 [Firmicutes bacterium]|nr:hypothetical protein [Bacillota bacterium]
MKGEIIIRIEEIMQFEIKAVSKTILEYTTDNFVTSYAEQIVTLKYPDQKHDLVQLIDRLLEWYEVEMKEIQKSDYVRSKESHQKSYSLLLDMKRILAGECNRDIIL